MTTMRTLKESKIRIYSDTTRRLPEHSKHPAANSGTVSAADLVMSSRDKEAVACSIEAALGGEWRDRCWWEGVRAKEY
jgi:hypothetical protein